MDQRKTGIFIAKCRKEKGLTQSNMAERLGITDRAISKWERGKSFPDPSIMVELCKVLDISANELLSGEKLTGDKYIVKAEENLTMLKKIERDSNRKLLVMENVIGILGITSFLTMIFTSGFWVNDIFGKIFFMAIGILIFLISMIICLKLEQSVGYYQCGNCGYTYVPKIKAVVLAKHKGRDRKMRCISCSEKNYHKKLLTR